MTKIYTRSGDTGNTVLFTGQQVSKESKIIEFLGLIDELNANLGLCVAFLTDEDMDFTSECEVIEEIQKDLFIVSSITAGAAMLFHSNEQVENIEKTIDEYEELLKPLQNFILPGGSISAGQIHVTRTAVRKIERYAVSLKSSSVMLFVPYLNRLSDLLFVMSRFVNHKLGISETIWKTK
jgi:cob(I)alamin adenosyltransferase